MADFSIQCFGDCDYTVLCNTDIHSCCHSVGHLVLFGTGKIDCVDIILSSWPVDFVRN
jgi:hypothetical protein